MSKKLSIDINKVVFGRTYDIRRFKDLSFLDLCDPSIQQFYEYWNSFRQNNKLVLKSEFLPEGMVTLLPRIFIVDKEPINADYRYKLIGSTELLFRKNNPTGQLVKDGHVGTVTDALENYDYVFQQKAHLFMICNIYRSEEYMVTDQTLFLPISKDGQDVDFCYGLSIQTIETIEGQHAGKRGKLVFDNNPLNL